MHIQEGIHQRAKLINKAYKLIKGKFVKRRVDAYVESIEDFIFMAPNGDFYKVSYNAIYNGKENKGYFMHDYHVISIQKIDLLSTETL